LAGAAHFQSGNFPVFCRQQNVVIMMWLGLAKCRIVVVFGGCAAQRSLRTQVKHPLKPSRRISQQGLLKRSHANGQPQGGYLHQPPEPHISLHRSGIGFLCTLPYSVIRSLDNSCRDRIGLHPRRLSSPACCQSHFGDNCWRFARLNPFSSHDVDPRSFLNCLFHYFALANIFYLIRRSI
jgi:hypothetical protein